MLFVPVKHFIHFLGLRGKKGLGGLNTDCLNLTSHTSTTVPAGMENVFGFWPPDKSRSNICSP